MKALAAVLQWMLGILALVVTLLALTPTEWKQKLSIWSSVVHPANASLLLAAAPLAIAAFTLGLYSRSRQQIVVWPTRKKWWDTRLPSIISACETLVVIDSYQGSKHQFWAALEKRVRDEAPFHFIMLDLAKGDPMLPYCVDTSLAHATVVDIDLRAIQRLFQVRASAGKGGNKTIEFGYWTGESQGPLVAWTIKRKEVIAFGLWQQVEGNTDLSPWLVSRRGPLFGSLKQHYESLLHKAKAAGNLHSSEAALFSARSEPVTDMTPERSLRTAVK
jgi:hypothetical protein